MILFRLIFSLIVSLQVCFAVTVQIEPKEWRENILALLPLSEDTPVDQIDLALVKRSLEATERFNQIELNFDKNSQILLIRIEPKKYFDSIEWSGDRISDRGSLERRCIHRREERPLSQERLTDIHECLKSSLQARGYLDGMAILSPKDDVLTIQTDIGKIYRVRNIILDSKNPLSPQSLKIRLNHINGSQFNPEELTEDTATIQRALLEQGYYFSTVFRPLLKVDPSAGLVDIKWKISDSKKFEVRFKGPGRYNKYLENMLDKAEPFATWFVDELVDEIKDEHLSQGYLDVEVNVVKTSHPDREQISFEINPGEIYKLKDPEWIGANNPLILDNFWLRFGDLSRKKFFNEEEFMTVFKDDFLNELYISGYLDLQSKGVDFKIDREKHFVKPIIYLNEGLIYKIEASDILGLPPEMLEHQDVEDLKDLLEPGNIFKYSDVKDAIKLLQQQLIAIGYLDAKIEDRYDKLDGKITTRILVSNGPRYKIGHILLRGLTRTDYDVIQRELFFKRGEYYSLESIKDTVAQILRLGAARSIDIQILEKDLKNESVVLAVDVSEAARFRFSFGPGYGTEDGLRFTAKATYANIGGRARRLTVYAKGNRKIESSSTPSIADVYDPHSTPFIERRISLEYFEPRAIKSPFDARFTYIHSLESKKKFDLRSDTFSLNFDYRWTRHWILTTTYQFEFSDAFNVIITDDVSAGEAKANRFTSLWQSINATYLDDDFNPTRGWKGKWSGRLYESRLGGDSNFWQVLTKQDFFRPLYTIKRGMNFGLGLSIQANFSDAYPDDADVPVEKRFYAGGEGSVRGYGEQSINPEGLLGGRSSFIIRSELNIPVLKGFDLLGFFDAGNTYQSNQDFRPLDLRFGTGFGVRWNSLVGPVKMGYGFIMDRRTLDDGSREPLGHFYIGIGPL